MSDKIIKKSIFKRWWFWVIIILIIIVIASSGDKNNTIPQEPLPGGQNQTPDDNTGEAAENTVQDTPQETENEKAAAFIKEGMYKIGSDLPAGEYILFNETVLPSYYQVTTDSTGSLESIVSNDNFNGNRYITVSEGQYLEFREAKGYTLENAPELKPVNGRYEEGMYKVGRDIDPGEYKLIPISESVSSYVEVAKDSKGSVYSIVSNDNFQSEKYISISKGQYIKLIGCYIEA